MSTSPTVPVWAPEPTPEGLTAPCTTIDRFTDADKLIHYAFKSAQIDGREPFVREFRIDQPVAPLNVLPEGARVERSATSDTHVVAFARCVTGGILVSAWPRGTIIEVSAASDELAESIVSAIKARLPLSDSAGTVSVRTWHMGCNEAPQSTDRQLAVPSWSDIENNYPISVRIEIEELLALSRPHDRGKLILWHGAPGTGKTTALRALLREWEPWCSAQYIADPEKMFSHPGYISDVLTRSPAPRYGPTLARAGEPEAVWRLVIAEDSDEYLRASARRDAGAALGRLLNLADGLLGQGFNTLVLLTTNEDLHQVHPALIRPGRCLARVQFTSFSVAESRAWLPDGTPSPDRACTLAELYERRGDLSRIGDHDVDRRVAPGQYL